MTDIKIRDSWLERVRMDRTASPRVDGQSSPVSQMRAGSSSSGWDPFDVWLQRVQKPRQLARQQSARD